jgi:hypothetical protein
MEEITRTGEGEEGGEGENEKRSVRRSGEHEKEEAEKWRIIKGGEG